MRIWIGAARLWRAAPTCQAGRPPEGGPPAQKRKFI